MGIGTRYTTALKEFCGRHNLDPDKHTWEELIEIRHKIRDERGEAKHLPDEKEFLKLLKQVKR